MGLTTAHLLCRRRKKAKRTIEKNGRGREQKTSNWRQRRGILQFLPFKTCLAENKYLKSFRTYFVLRHNSFFLSGQSFICLFTSSFCAHFQLNTLFPPRLSTSTFSSLSGHKKQLQFPLNRAPPPFGTIRTDTDRAQVSLPPSGLSISAEKALLTRKRKAASKGTTLHLTKACLVNSSGTRSKISLPRQVQLRSLVPRRLVLKSSSKHRFQLFILKAIVFLLVCESGANGYDPTAAAIFVVSTSSSAIPSFQSIRKSDTLPVTHFETADRRRLHLKEIAENKMESNGANAAPTIDEAVERTASPRQPNPVPSLRSISDPQPAIPSPQPLASINAARRPGGAMPPPSSTAIRNGALPKDVAARLQAFHASRQAAPQQFTPNLNLPGFTGSPSAIGGSNIRARPAPPPNWSSAPAIGRPTQSLGARRGLKLPGGLPGASPITDSSNPVVGAKSDNNMFNKYAEYVDTKTGALKFAGKAIIHSKGVEFSSGGSFSISLQDVDIQDELGKGNYGTVYKVVHRKIRVPKAVPEPDDNTVERPQLPETEPIVMAMKQIRLELEDSKFAQIVMELDVLHKCTSPFIIDFYGAFFQEGAVYMCIEYMDGGSVDKIYHGGVPERVLRKIAHAVTKGLLCLKEDHNIIHRDVKPTNILVNTKGEVKLCDFGVSGNLVASIAKTNIGCQSYMAPERIASGGFQAAMMGNTNGTYSVQSDIWSLGLSLLECALGRYPYPPETYNTIFSQLSVSIFVYIVFEDRC